MAQFRFERQEIPDVVVVEAEEFRDHRGIFVETYRRSVFAANGIDLEFVQDNLSRSSTGVLRGLHYQNPPLALGKLVGVLRGEIFDVAVDIRSGSPTFSRWVGALLSAENRRMLWVPRGFAHGFVALRESDVVYKMTGEYAPEAEAGVAWNDPEIGIRWPLEHPTLSEKDAKLPALADADNGFTYASSPREGS
jgi:dTDP-4-dehydrorhamnose 3,5-epimerase